MIENKFERVENPADPSRCQSGSGSHGQCLYKALPGSQYCARHGGNAAQQSTQKKVIRKYQLAQWQDRKNEFADHDDIKSLREEIGILRMVMENMLTQCHSPRDMLMWSTKIVDTALKINTVIASCHRLEASTGMLLDKSSALHLASLIVDIIGKYVTDEEQIDKISTDIAVAILQLNSKDITE